VHSGAVSGNGTRKPGRRSLSPALCAVLLWAGTALPAAVARAEFGLEEVANKARELARQPFSEKERQVPEWLTKITYDQWRDIRFRPDHALALDPAGRFRVQFFHTGLYYHRAVAINLVDGKGVRPVQFSPSQFDYGKNTFGKRVPADLGYAGLRLHYPINTPTYHDEVIVFVGASYFRALGKGEVYGLSARGIGVDTALPSPEEFPDFREFWLVTPQPGAASVTVYALLDGPSVTGAYRFDITPGDETTVNVACRIFLRRPVQKLGIAPLTSMFMRGENTTRVFQDFRPEIHDSDGLLLNFDGGEWLWRPLDNPTSVNASSFLMENPRGFGLIQRDREFDHYQDLETHSELRPSVWVSVQGEWGRGRVELVEIPTNREIDDNVVAFWVPDALPPSGDPLALAYTLFWGGGEASRPPGGRVIATRRDRGTHEGAHRLVVDFAGGELSRLREGKTPEAIVSVAGGAQAGELLEQQVVSNPAIGGWRLTCQVRPKTDRPLELRAFLRQDDHVLTETWSYVLR